MSVCLYLLLATLSENFMLANGHGSTSVANSLNLLVGERGGGDNREEGAR